MNDFIGIIVFSIFVALLLAFGEFVTDHFIDIVVIAFFVFLINTVRKNL